MLVRNRLSLTRQALNSLTDMSAMNVTILDDRSDDETRFMLRSWCEENAAHLVRNETPMGTGPLRNLVISKSEQHYGRADYLALSDNDVMFLPNWLEELIACYEFAWEQGFRILGGYSHPFHQPFLRMRHPDLPHGIAAVHALATQSMLLKWEAWETFGPFCQTPIDRVCQSEDVELSNRVSAAGYKVGVIVPAVIVSTGITNTFGEKIPGWELVKAACPEGIICE